MTSKGRGLYRILDWQRPRNSSIRVVVLLSLLAFAEIVSAQASGPRQKDVVDFSSPRREYTQLPGDLYIFVEDGMARSDPKTFDAATTKLRAVLPELIARLPEPTRKTFMSMHFYLMWGKKSPLGGLDNGMRYVRRGEPGPRNHYDRRWENSIVIYSADNLLYLDDLWTRKALMHEMGHAWHLLNWTEKHPPIYTAWQNAVATGLYTNANDSKGRILPKAYALQNQLEYFAELSAGYFVGLNYHPFTSEALRSYDPVGWKMIEKLWRTQ